MNSKEEKLFSHFKKQIITTYLKSNSGNKDVKKWSGDDIVSFQEDLLSKVNTQVSEKWFYNYFKNNPEKLPRIDILNILSNYIGYKNWNEYKKQQSKNNNQKYFWLLSILIFVIVFFLFRETKNIFHFCFYDEDKSEKITIPVNIKILKKNESPLFFKSDEKGCFTYHTKDSFIKLIISSSYYKTDTIRREINSYGQVINLTTDDYALMLDYYTNNKLKNWRERKEELNKLIDNKAVIYQLFSKNIGVEIYDKEEFINLLTIPTSSLKKIKIVSKEFKNGKIIKLKFIIK